jgi:hypothetical protein
MHRARAARARALAPRATVDGISSLVFTYTFAWICRVGWSCRTGLSTLFVNFGIFW